MPEPVRPPSGSMIRVEADPVHDEWTGSLVGKVVSLAPDWFVLDAGVSGTWEILYSNQWEEV